MAVPAKVEKRLKANLGHFQKILRERHNEGINEANTSTIIQDMLADLLGYNKYQEIESEYGIKSRFCDIAIRIKGAVVLLIECKPIDSDLKRTYVQQAVDYAANEGIDWTILTNGIEWQVYRVVLKRTVDENLVLNINILDLKTRSATDIEKLSNLCRERVANGALKDYYEKYRAVNKYTVAAAVRRPEVVAAIRSVLRKANKGISVLPAEIDEILVLEVLKNSLVEDEKTIESQRALARNLKKLANSK